MTEDHRVTSYSERLRIQAIGTPLREGETRICGNNPKTPSFRKPILEELKKQMGKWKK